MNKFQTITHHDGSVTVTHLESGIQVTKRGAPVSTMNYDAAMKEIQEVVDATVDAEDSEDNPPRP